MKDGSTDARLPLGAGVVIAQDTIAQAVLASGWQSRASVPYVPELLNTIVTPARITTAAEKAADDVDLAIDGKR